MTEREHIFSVIGTGPYQETAYEMNGRSISSKFCTEALVDLLELSDPRITILATPKAAERNLEACHETIRNHNVESVEIPEGRTEEQEQIFETVVNCVESGEALILDITHALRHIPFLMSAAATYASSLKKARLAGIYYGAWELRDKSVVPPRTPVIDVTPWYTHLVWFHAVEAVREGTNWQSLERVLKGDVKRLFQSGERPVDLSTVKDAVGRFVDPVGHGLPLEAGFEACRLRQAINELDNDGKSCPAGRFVACRLADVLAEWELEPVDKSSISLNEVELERQLRFVEFLADRNEPAQALSILREWLVSFVILVRGSDAWLSRPTREEAEWALNVLSERNKHRVLDDCNRKALASLWASIRDRRNKLMHAGMTKEPVTVRSEGVKELIQKCRELLQNHSKFDLEPGCGDRLLVGSIGYRPGALFTAVVESNPDRLILLCSRDTEGLVQELMNAVRREIRKDVPLVEELIVISDPQSGTEEAQDILDKDRSGSLASAEEVILTLTGGTSLMQHIVEGIGREAERIGVPVRRILTFDNRTGDEQIQNPFVRGGIIDIPLPTRR